MQMMQSFRVQHDAGLRRRRQHQRSLSTARPLAAQARCVSAARSPSAHGLQEFSAAMMRWCMLPQVRGQSLVGALASSVAGAAESHGWARANAGSRPGTTRALLLPSVTRQRPWDPPRPSPDGIDTAPRNACCCCCRPQVRQLPSAVRPDSASTARSPFGAFHADAPAAAQGRCCRVRPRGSRRLVFAQRRAWSPTTPPCSRAYARLGRQYSLEAYHLCWYVTQPQCGLLPGRETRPLLGRRAATGALHSHIAEASSGRPGPSATQPLVVFEPLHLSTCSSSIAAPLSSQRRTPHLRGPRLLLEKLAADRHRAATGGPTGRSEHLRPASAISCQHPQHRGSLLQHRQSCLFLDDGCQNVLHAGFAHKG